MNKKQIQDKTDFESQYTREITLLKVLEGVSFDSALENLYFEFKRLEGDIVKFKVLLKEWELN